MYTLIGEFTEETEKILSENDKDLETQILRRKKYGFSYILHEVYINNFCLQIIFI